MKTLNLTSYGVEEIKEVEMSEVNGGGAIMDVWNILKEVDSGWDNFKARLKAGWDSYECNCHCS
jgi:hypothetical protein